MCHKICEKCEELKTNFKNMNLLWFKPHVLFRYAAKVSYSFRKISIQQHTHMIIIGSIFRRRLKYFCGSFFIPSYNKILKIASHLFVLSLSCDNEETCLAVIWLVMRKFACLIYCFMIISSQFNCKYEVRWSTFFSIFIAHALY